MLGRLEQIIMLLALPILSALAVPVQAPTPLSTWVQKINGLKSIQAQLIVARPGQASQTYTVALQKPSSVRIDDADETVYADGKTITVYRKTRNYFYTRPQTDDELKSVLGTDNYALFRPFFDEKAFGGRPTRVRDSRTIGGESVRPIEVAPDPNGKKVLTLYVSPDGIARKGERLLKTPNGNVTTVLTAKEVTLDATLPDDTFAFKAPDGAQELPYADLIASKWFTDLDAAKAVADKTGRQLLLDFALDSKMSNDDLKKEVYETNRFRAYGDRFVFVHVNLEDQPTIGAAFSITQVPTVIVAKADGTEVRRTLDTTDVEAFYEFLDAPDAP